MKAMRNITPTMDHYPRNEHIADTDPWPYHTDTEDTVLSINWAKACIRILRNKTQLDCIE